MEEFIKSKALTIGIIILICLFSVCNIDAQNFQVQDVTITHSGIGNIKIWATNTLNVTFSGIGDILYKGNPTIFELYT